MTIYKPKLSEEKGEKKSPLKSAVVEPLTATTKPVQGRQVPATVRVIQARRRHCIAILGALLIVLIILITSAVAGFLLYRYLALQKNHVETAEVRYFEYQKSSRQGQFNSGSQRRRVQGTFVERIEIDETDYLFEKLEVPPILESRRSTVVHDFEKNLTAIVDRDNGRCFVLPLNRTAIKPPRSFMDLLVKYRSGYYLPDAEIIRDNFKVQLPAVSNLEPFGFYIWFDCRFYFTYRLIHDDSISTQPRVISKRSACDMEGQSYCLGDTGMDKMVCFTITECV